MMQLDLRKTPFSTYSSFLAISQGILKDTKPNHTLYLRDLSSGDEDPGYLFALNIINEQAEQAPYSYTCDETHLSLREEAGEGRVDVCFPEGSCVQFSQENCTVELDFFLTGYDHINLVKANTWELTSYTHHMRLLVEATEGAASDELEWDTIRTRSGRIRLHGPSVQWRCIRYRTVIPAMETIPFTTALAMADNRFKAWKKVSFDPERHPLHKSIDLARYITYSCVVPAEGMLQYPAMYMSNNWMTNTWSWDNCFNALALSARQPELAMQQLLMFEPYQDESGMLPDYMNNLTCSYDCTKPPLYGWAYHTMMEHNSYFSERTQVERIYPILKKVEHFWTHHRVSSAFPLPYYSHGNDSGWDNATVFAAGCPVSSPDLPSYLILLYRALARIAALMGLSEEEALWNQRRDAMKTSLLANLWREDSFVSYIHSTGEYTVDSHSLINLMPLVIADELPEQITSLMVSHLVDDGFLTEYGIATEAIHSPLYEYDGYWRGPVWAPVTLLLIDGLHRAGLSLKAKDVAERFIGTCTIGGMAENFDPLSGEGLVDPAYTWTSSVFLYLVEHYHTEVESDES